MLRSPTRPTSGAQASTTASASLAYFTYLGGSDTSAGDSGQGIAVDTTGNVTVAGTTGSTDFPTLGAVQTTFGGNTDAFVSRVNAAGSALIYSSYLGGSSYDVGMGCAIDASGNAYVTGYTSSTNFPTAGALQGTDTSSTDNIFLSKIGPGSVAPGDAGADAAPEEAGAADAASTPALRTTRAPPTQPRRPTPRPPTRRARTRRA